MSTFDVEVNGFLDKLELLAKRYETVSALLEDPEVFSDPHRYKDCLLYTSIRPTGSLSAQTAASEGGSESI